MNDPISQELYKVYTGALQPPYNGGFQKWCEANIELPPAYAIPGRLDISTSPYLIEPMLAVDNPKIMQINLCAATQIGKSLIAELFIPYVIINNPGPIFRIFHNKEVSDVFAETRLIPLLKNCKVIKPLLNYDRFTTTKSAIKLPHMAVTMGGSNTALQHGMSVKYLLCDELHEWDHGQFSKFMARTTAFAGRRKIICSSQPSVKGSEWETLCNKGLIYDWQWQCPECKQHQPFYWSKEREDESYAGFNWDTVLNADETTNIALTAATTWLECLHCRHKVQDTPRERRLLNDTGKYVCVKNDGDQSVVTYSAPNFVNVNLSFASSAAQYLIAKRQKKTTGLDDQMQIFVTQVLGNFYKAEEQIEMSKILIENYEKDNLGDEWVKIMTVDVQRTGQIKYYVIRAWRKDGSASKRIDFGIKRTFKEIEDLRVKHNIDYNAVGVDSGDGEMTQEVYQQCLLHGKVVKVNGNLLYYSWRPLKGDQKLNYTTHPDKVARLYSPISNQDSGFPVGHKLHGYPAPLTLFSNYSVKTILSNLRDNKLEGIKWVIDRPDEEYDRQLYSEQMLDVVDKKSGVVVKRWIQTNSSNHFFDCENMNLTMAIIYNLFSATKINEGDILSMIKDKEKDKAIDV